MNPRTWGRRGWSIAIAVVIIVPVAGLFAVYQIMFQGSNVAPLTAATPVATHAPVPASTLAGTYAVSSSSSTVGYRVREKLAFKDANSDAVGRTNAVTGTGVVEAPAAGLTLETASFSADVSKLTSDDDRRDNRIRTIGLETDTFPTATYALTSPTVIPASALTGALTKVSISGNLTLHGVTKHETFPVTITANGTTVTVTGSLTFPWGDFDMQEPDVGGFVTIDGNPTLEFQLVLTKTSSATATP